MGPMDDWLLWGPNRWEMYQHRRTRRRRLSFSLGGTGYCHGVGNIPVEASGSTRVGTFFSFYIRPCLSFSPSPFGISLPQAWLCIISYVFYHHLDKIEGLEKRSERQRIKHLPKPKLPCPARCAVCTESRPPKGQLKCFIRPARA